MEVSVDVQKQLLPVSTDKTINKSSLQVYPSPASEWVHIVFQMKEAGYATVTITDIQGRTLAVIQDGNLSEGFHKLRWNADVHSGLYFVTFRTASGIQQKQLVIQE